MDYLPFSYVLSAIRNKQLRRDFWQYASLYFWQSVDIVVTKVWFGICYGAGFVLGAAGCIYLFGGAN